MRKPNQDQRTSPKSPAASKEQNPPQDQTRNWLNKLNGAQLVQVFNGMVQFANAATSLAAEQEKTRQVEIGANAEHHRLDVEEKKVISDFQVEMARISLQTKQNYNSHLENIQRLEQTSASEMEKQNHISRIIDLVQNGAISDTQLQSLLVAVISKT